MFINMYYLQFRVCQIDDTDGSNDQQNNLNIKKFMRIYESL